MTASTWSLYAGRSLSFWMRRAVVEFAVKDIAEMAREPSIELVESLEVLSFLRSNPREVAGVCRLRFKNPATKIQDVFTDPSDRIQVLEKEDKGTYVCFFKGGLHRKLAGVIGAVSGGYPSFPYEVRDGRIKVTLLGNASAIQRFLGAFGQAGLRYKLVSLTDAKFLPNSPLSSLTDKQRKVITAAFDLGYYDLPKRIGSRELAMKLNIREQTLVIHRRKAERRLLGELLRESW